MPALAKNESLTDRTIADIAAERGADPLDVMLDLGLEENLETMFIGQFLNVGDEGVARLLRHDAGVVALSDAGAHLTFMCEAGYGLHFLAHWVRERGEFDLADGVRRLTSHPADLYGIPDRGRIAAGAWADLLLFDPDTVGVTASERIADLPGGGKRTIPPADRRPRRVLQRRRGLRRQRLRHERAGGRAKSSTASPRRAPSAAETAAAAGG